MSKELVLGIDCGGTHTDAALLEVKDGGVALLAAAKTITLHDALPQSITTALESLRKELPDPSLLGRVERITLGTTLEVNALVQNKADRVGLALSAGPGLDPSHFALGEHVCIVPGGLDHRGVEVKKLFTAELARQAAAWPAQGVRAIACVGKFSPRNPAHEDEMAAVAAKSSGLPATVGHKLSGRLNFPRRIATAYYNAAVGRIHQAFLDSVEQAFRAFGLDGQFRLLKADGGAIPFALSRQEPVQSILSGPAASVMGVMALWAKAASGCALLLDMGGTTTDMALFLEGSPVVDRQGMILEGRRTLVRSLAAISIGVGGDSLIHIQQGPEGKKTVHAGPMREGPAMAFGGSRPTLLDALNFLDGAPKDRGNVEQSRQGILTFAQKNGLEAEQCAQAAVRDALGKINQAAYGLVEKINSGPIYTLAALKAARQARPTIACLVGGPAQSIRARLEQALGMPVEIAPHSHVANAIGAALAIPTASLEVYADTGRGEISVPALDLVDRIKKNSNLEDIREIACDLLRKRLADADMDDGRVEVVEADLFATLDDYGRGSRDMRVVCQARPGIMASLA